MVEKMKKKCYSLDKKVLSVLYIGHWADGLL